jgi:hypothetical protein
MFRISFLSKPFLLDELTMSILNCRRSFQHSGNVGGKDFEGGHYCSEVDIQQGNVI